MFPYLVNRTKANHDDFVKLNYRTFWIPAGGYMHS